MERRRTGPIAWRVVALAIVATLVAFGLRTALPALGRLDQHLLRPRIDATTESPFLIVEVGPDAFAKAGLRHDDPRARRFYARLVETAVRARAKGVVFDLEFRQAGDPKTDEDFRRAVAASPIPIVVPAVLRTVGPEGATFDKPPIFPDDSPVVYGSTRSHPEEAVAELVAGDDYVPFFHLGLLAAAIARGLDPYRDVDWYEGRATLGGRDLSTDSRGRYLVPEVAPPPSTPIADLLASPERVRGRVLLVGHVGGTDRHATPFGPMEGVTFVALVASALYGPPTPVLASGWITLVSSFLLAVLAGASVIGLRPYRAVLGILLAATLAWFSPGWAGPWLGMTSPLTSLLAIALVSVALGSWEAFALRRRVYGRSTPIDEPATVMFVDLVGSTPLVRSLGPSAADRVMRAVIQRLADTAEESGAEIERPLGDGVLLHWRGGEPGDQVRRALDAIPVLRGALRARPIRGLPPDFEPDLTFGIEQGQVVGSPISIRDLPQWMSSGETVNLASRLQGLCSSLGETCLLGPSAGTLAGPVRAISLGEHEIKGFGAVVVYRAR